MAHFVPRVPLVQFAKSGVMNPFQDAVFTVSRVLFQHFPIPPTIGAIKGAKLDGPNLLVDAMEIGKEDAAALQALASECTTKAELSARITAGGKASARLSKLLPFCILTTGGAGASGAAGPLARRLLGPDRPRP